MSFIKKTLSTCGIGSAKVDSVLQQDVLYPGEKANIAIYVYGGSSDQLIDNIDVRLCCRYIADVLDLNKDPSDTHRERVHKTHVLATWSLPYPFSINPGEERRFNVEFKLPWNMPITVGDTKVWLETGLDISMVLDPTDKDILTVRPDPMLDAVFSTFEYLGFRLRRVECEAINGFSLPFVQEFEFVPITGPYHGCWREIEIIANRDEKQLTFWFGIDRIQKEQDAMEMLASLLEKGKLEHHIRFPISTSIADIGQKVFDYLEEVT